MRQGPSSFPADGGAWPGREIAAGALRSLAVDVIFGGVPDEEAPMTGSVRPNGEKIRQLRDQKVWTQEELADKAGVSLRTIQSAERGLPLQRYTVQCIAEAFGVEVSILLSNAPIAEAPRRPGIPPPFPPLFVGRREDMAAIKGLLGILGDGSDPSPPSASLLLVVHGWPGVGKSTVQAQLAYDDCLGGAFQDGVYWFSAGQQFGEKQLLSVFKALGARMGDDLDGIDSIPDDRQRLHDAASRVRDRLRGKRALIMVDDVWEPSWGEWFRLPRPCATLLTTRVARVADELALSDGGRKYRLGVLAERESLDLLTALVPEVVGRHEAVCRQLVGPQFLDGLPLALRVAAGLLRKVAERAGPEQLDMAGFLEEVRDGARVLRERPPPGIEPWVKEAPTVAAVFEKSIRLLDQTARECFRRLGSVAVKPARFDLRLVQRLWKKERVESPERQADELIDQGLLEAIPAAAAHKAGYQMHGLLADYARSLPPPAAAEG
jgi:transcriptional regulator with XRE-family HTH domain